MTTDLLTPRPSTDEDDLLALNAGPEMDEGDFPSVGVRTQGQSVRIVLHFSYHPPDWFASVVSEATDLLALPQGWDSYGARPIQLSTFTSALELLANVVKPELPAPDVFPTAEGGLAFEWQHNEQSLEVRVNRPNRGELLFENFQTDEEFAEAFTTIGPLVEYLERLMA